MGANDDLNEATDWARYIYQSNGVEVPELAEMRPNAIRHVVSRGRPFFSP